jgi:hypothetical protein
MLKHDIAISLYNEMVISGNNDVTKSGYRKIAISLYNDV